MLRMDIQQEMIPSYLRETFKRSVKVPSKQDLRKSAIILNDMMAMYGFSTHQGVAIIYVYPLNLFNQQVIGAFNYFFECV